MDNSQKVVRKIDAVDKRVEKSFENTIMNLAEIYSSE